MNNEVLKKALGEFFNKTSFKLMPSGKDEIEIEIEPSMDDESEMESKGMDEPKDIPSKLMKGMK